MSEARAKKKRRQRARGAAGTPAAGGGGTKVAPSAAGGGAKAARPAAGGGAKAARPAAGAGAKASRDAVARPRPIWAPFPLTEIGMAAGIVIFGAGLASNSIRTVSIGALVLAVVTGELCLREHFAGFRSHTLLLAALPVSIAHGAVVFAITDAYRGPLTLAADLAAGGALAWWLRARYRQARETSRV